MVHVTRSIITIALALTTATSALPTQLFARTGPFAKISEKKKEEAKAFVSGVSHDKLSSAAAAGSSAKTFKTDKNFHLDRQQPSSDRYQSKVAVQLNRGSPSTIGQVVVPKGTDPKPKTVAAKLKHSINTGKEQEIRHREFNEGEFDFYARDSESSNAELE